MIINLIKKYKDIILYAFFGVCTTIINVLAYWISSHLLHIDTLPSSVIAWFVAVLFAYVTNRKWVFSSTANGTREIIKEIISFYIMRLTTGIIDWLGMYILVDLMHFDDMIIKVIMNILVILLNYIASKLIVFRKK